MAHETYNDDQDRAHRLFDDFMDSPPPASDPDFYEVVARGLSSSWGEAPPAGHGYPRKDG